VVQQFFVRLLAALLTIGIANFAFMAPTQASPRQLMGAINGEQPIQLQGLQITSDISGGMAETTVRMVFFNPNSRPLEGNLQFPLLPNQQITGFSLDINGQMRKAVPVEKAKGRQVFEEIERRRVDPALLEVTQGNNFKLRVFPIPALGTRTVQLTYAENMTRQGQNWVYQLPLGYDENVKNFGLVLNVNGSKAEPQISAGSHAIKFGKFVHDYQAKVYDAQFAQADNVTVLTPADSEPQAYVQERGGETYFIAEVPVPTERAQRPLPKVVGILWDSSGSGANRQIDAELNELGIYLKALGNAEVRLTRLRDHAEPTESFKVRDGNWDELRKALKQTVYDGASALGDWKPESKVGEYLLFSDGLINYGTGSFPMLTKKKRLYALNSATSSDSGWLAAQAERTGGRLIQVSALSPGAAAESLLTEGPHLIDMDSSGATNLQIESADSQQGLLRIAGKLKVRDAELNLTLSLNGNSGNLQTLHIPVSANAPVNPLAAHFWANYRLHVLAADRELQRGEIRRIGQEFGIPTGETSLIVLESVDDYLRYDIAPPAEYKAEFDKLRSIHSTQKRQDAAQHLAMVVGLFNAKVAWWEKNFPKYAPSKAVPEKYAPGASADDNVQRTEITGSIIRRVEHESASPVQVIAADDLARAPAYAPPAIAAPRPVAEARAVVAAPAPVVAPSASIAPIQALRIASPKIANSVVESQGEATVTLKKWSSNAPYIARMKAASKETIYAIYLDEKPSYSNSSAFYLDASDLLLEKGQRELALRVLSNLAEMDLENRQVLRILGYRLMEMGAAEQAIPIFQKVLRLAEDEPQSFRDLGLAYEAAKHYQQAIDSLNEVVLRPWDGRTPDIEIISLAELNAIIATKMPSKGEFDTSRIDPRLLKNLPLDLRVAMTWDADNSDMDLWVTDPSGEKCYYGHALTVQGGRMSRDVTQGYGPEEFSLRFAMPGKYKVEANFYGNRQQVVAGATTLQVKLSTGFGTTKQKDQTQTLRLKDRGETVFVGEFEVKP